MIIRSSLFYLFITIWTLIFGLIFSPLLITKNQHTRTACKFWARISMLGLRLICGISYQIEGLEHLPRMPYIVASKHQSALETILFWLIFPNPVYILKKELLRIPVFGWYLFRLGMIYIDRSSGASALKQIIIKTQEALKEPVSIIVFPEGTRHPPAHHSTRYFPGITAIYNANNASIVPVALNTGICWPGKKLIMKPGMVTIRILPPIKPGLDKDKFMTKLNEEIERSSLELISL